MLYGSDKKRLHNLIGRGAVYELQRQKNVLDLGWLALYCADGLARTEFPGPTEPPAVGHSRSRTQISVPRGQQRSQADLVAKLCRYDQPAYKIRTAAIDRIRRHHAQVTSDFSPAGGPSVRSADGRRTPDLPVHGVRAGQWHVRDHNRIGRPLRLPLRRSALTSLDNGRHTASVAWTLTDDSAYQAGTYSATVTFHDFGDVSASFGRDDRMNERLILLPLLNRRPAVSLAPERTRE